MSEQKESPRVDRETGEVLGEGEPVATPGARGIASVARERAKRSMVQKGTLFVAMSGTALAALYLVTPHANSERQAAAEAARRGKTALLNAEMPVGRIHVDPISSASASPAAEAVLGPAPELPPGAVDGGSMGTNAAGMQPAGVGTSSAHHHSTEERLLSGPVMYRASNSAGPVGPAISPGVYPGMPDPSLPQQSGTPSALGAAMKPTATPAVRAERLPERRWLLQKGAFVDCTLETAIDSTLPGLTTCVLALDVFSADGRVVLLERGTRLVGEARADVRPGQRRVAVLWTEARTPTGVIAHLDSLGTDELGRSGIAGLVDNHFGDRFGAAILISMIDAGSQALANRSSGSSGSVVVSPSRSTDILTETLRSTIAIPPTINVPQGARLQVLVARDVDFRSVYALKDRT